MTDDVSTNQIFQDELIDLKSLLDNSFDGLMICDGKGRTLYVNKALSDMHSISQNEFINKTISDLLEENMISESLVEEVICTQKPLTKQIFLKSGKSLYSTATPIFKNGTLWRIIINARDITDIIKLSARLEENIIEIDKYKEELKRLRNSRLEEGPFISRSKEMSQVWDTALMAAKSSATVLLHGETGTGKEVIARAIHTHSSRAANPFVAVNCSALPETLIESELFGYEKGAFTDARHTKIGLFEQAQQGTLLLDEIGELSMVMQVKLLRVLQERELRRIGGSRNIRLDVRIIAASNKNLASLMEEGLFRRDLFYRLNVIQVTVPPLRERPEDIGGFIWFFLNKFNRQYSLMRTLHPLTLRMLTSYGWPGNIRELENVMERLVVLCPHEEISPQYLPDDILQKDSRPRHAFSSLKDAAGDGERKYLELLAQQHHSLRKMAAVARVSHTTIARKLRHYKIPIPRDDT